MVGQPDVDAACAVNSRVVVLSVRPVHVGAQRAARRVGLCVLERCGGCSGYQVDECLVVPVLVQREVDDLLRLQLGVNVRLVGLQQLGLRRDRHRFG